MGDVLHIQLAALAQNVSSRKKAQAVFENTVWFGRTAALSRTWATPHLVGSSLLLAWAAASKAFALQGLCAAMT